jgi:hypothetical protein
LRACCLGARGLWADMLCYMHQGTPYGHLTLPAVSEDGGKDILRPILTPVLARMVGGTSEDVEGLLAELEHAGVFSRTAEGVVFSRRMVQDEKLRETRASGGANSLKNPNVPRPKDGRKDTFSGSLGESFGGSPSSSSSSSLKIKTLSSNPEGFDQAVLEVWNYFVATLNRSPQTTLTETRKRMARARLKECFARAREPQLENATNVMKVCVGRLKSSKWHNGNNPGGKTYLTWEILFRSREQFEKWINDENFREGAA